MKPAATRVLMVDDDEGVRFGVRDFLALHGFQVEEAADCRQAVDVFRASVCDITIIDHGLPDGDAIALIAKLKAINANVAAVVLTGHGSIDLAVRAMQAGAEHFLVKPVNLHSLKAVLDRLVEQLRCRKAGLAARSQRQRDALGACRAWGVDSEKRPQRGQFLPDLQAHSSTMGQKAGKKWTAEAVSQPTIPKSDRLLDPFIGSSPAIRRLAG